MIFNSISKELNTPKYHPNTNKPEHYTNISYPHRDSYKLYNHQQNLQYQQPEKESALSQMNQKITDSLQYYKYKDYLRQKDLQSSRLSNSSQHSFRSNRSRHSNLSQSRVSLQSPSRQSHIRTKKSEHYFPQLIQNKLQNKPWQTQLTSHYQNYNTIQSPQQPSQYRQFLRKPITIENYTQKYGLTSSKHEGMPNQNVREFKSNISYRNKTQEPVIGKDDYEASNQTFASPMNKEFMANLGSDSKSVNKKVKIMPQSENRHEKISSRMEVKAQKQKQPVLSPLEIPKPNNNNGIIIAAILIGLGLLMFILQVTK